VQLLQPLWANGVAWSAAAVAVVSTLALVFGWSANARLHFELARDFRRLLAQLESAGEHVDSPALDGLCAQYHQLAAQEPAPMAGLVRACQNQLAPAMGGAVRPQPWLERVLMHVWDFPAARA
jgi:hypothetical protein